ncbi:MAG: phage morphogenesis protein [Sphingopyxis sp.]|uniref:hypothetical protein n=1 Tax=Sphingopyxis sp. TaxID=1908224 RepID=UPI003D80D32D
MTASKSLTWTGDAVSARWKRAQVAGVNATMGAAVIHAKRNHPWKNRTGILEGAINVTDAARPIATGVEGVWGVNDAIQARILEVGGVIKAKHAAALAIPLPGGGVVFRKSVVIPAFPYLRPAGDATYPSLAMRIQRAHERDAGGTPPSPGAPGNE